LRNVLTEKDKRKLQKDEQGPTLKKTCGGAFTTVTTINFNYKLIEITHHHNLAHNFKVDNTQTKKQKSMISSSDKISFETMELTSNF